MAGDISYCKIYPGIGIARLGNSPEEYFIGPEAPGVPADPGRSFKDEQGRIKRQAARFRVYAFDEHDRPVRELTDAEATITWTVHLANCKAAWNEFIGEPRMKKGERPPPRNASERDRQKLIIDPGPRSIGGRSVFGPEYHFESGQFYDIVAPLGELRTDEMGRLLVLGGFGRSGSLPDARPIRNYANNDGWYDDTSDGPVTATVILKDESRTAIPVRGASRVIVAPPDFAPQTQNLVTLYDVMEAVFAPERPTVSFLNDIYPILERINGYQWVNALAVRGHGPGRGGDFLAQVTHLAKNSQETAAARRSIFARIRNPAPPDGETAKAEADYYYMPPISGDGGDTKIGRPDRWLTVHPRQYEALRRWAEGDFEEDWDGFPPPPRAFDVLDISEQPRALDRAALEACVGGAFYPGIEMTFIARQRESFIEPFRLAIDIEPGGVTKWMAVPWQADFYECRVNWWPAQRPDDVVTEEEYESVLSAFARGQTTPALAPYFFDRARWERGVGDRPPPKPKKIGRPDSRDYDEQAGFDRDAAAYDTLLQWQWELLKRSSAPGKEIPQPKAVRPPEVADYDTRAQYATALAQYDLILQRQWMLDIQYAGDNEMVSRWSDLGFVAPCTARDGVTVFAERDRGRYAGLSDREYFYIMHNLQTFPDFLPMARALTEKFLKHARDLQNDPTTPDYYLPFPYTPAAYDARLDEIYNRLVAETSAYDPDQDPVFTKDEDCVERIRQFSPFNLLDGAWLRNATHAGPIDEIRALLFSIWSDETGNGDPSQNHANIYLDLMHSVGLYPEAVNTREFAHDPALLDSAFTNPLFELCISQFSDEYFPEILGMTLQLEWEVVELKRTIKLLKARRNPRTNGQFPFNTLFYEMHVGIDNAVDGHGAKIKRAVQIYLDHIRNDGGEDAVQEQWRRIWDGYVAFATTGSLGDDLNNLLQHPPSPQDKLLAMISRKAPYARLNHDGRKLGTTLINDLFESPGQLLRLLQEAGYIIPGDPEESRFFSLLKMTGPMYKVFSEDEIRLWEEWTRWLKPTGPDRHEMTIGQQMAALIKLLRVAQEASRPHRTEELTGEDGSGRRVTQPVAWWFAQEDQSLLMRALRDPANGWVVPGSSAESRFVWQLLNGSNRMAAAFAAVVPGTGKTGRAIAIAWINAGCPLPEEAVREETAPRRRDAAPGPAVLSPAVTALTVGADLAETVQDLASMGDEIRPLADVIDRRREPLAKPRQTLTVERVPRLSLSTPRALVSAHPAGRILGNGTIH